MSTRCPDCNASEAGHAVRHAESCPLFWRMNAIADADATRLAMFGPGANYRRELAPLERSEFRRYRPDLDPDEWQMAVSMEDGIVARRFARKGGGQA